MGGSFSLISPDNELQEVIEGVSPSADVLAESEAGPDNMAAAIKIPLSDRDRSAIEQYR